MVRSANVIAFAGCTVVQKNTVTSALAELTSKFLFAEGRQRRLPSLLVPPGTLRGSMSRAAPQFATSAAFLKGVKLVINADALKRHLE